MSRRSSKTKKIDKKMELIKAQFRKNHLVMKKTKSSMAKMRSSGRYISSLPPEPWLTAFAYFVINAMPAGGGGKMKKALMKLMKEQYSPEEWIDVEPLYESMMEDAESLMEAEQFELLIEMEDLVSLLEELMMEAEQLDGRLTVEKLNQDAKIIKGKQLTVEQVKEQKRIRFFEFFNKFQSKLASLGINDDGEITKFLLAMTNAVHKVKIANRVEIKGKKEVKKSHGQ